MKESTKTKIIFGLIIFVTPWVLYIFVGNILTIIARANPNQERFINGELPNPLPNGTYNGKAEPVKFNWLGKSFESATQTGINNFSNSEGIYKMFSFKTYPGKGVDDKELDVLVIDYDIPGNPFFIRWIRDEIVEVAPGKYLGKAHLRLLQFVPFTLIYFELEAD